MRTGLLFFAFIFIFRVTLPAASEFPYILILGTAQDGGYPHIGCLKECCAKAWNHPENKTGAVSFALVDPGSKLWWLFEATPDIKEQLNFFRGKTGAAFSYLPDGIFITHAHIGHYSGLMQLGKEAMNSKEVPVYVLPGMKKFLETNGPWSQLVNLKNISLFVLNTGSALELIPSISVQAFTVPHRDEFSETAGFRILTAAKKYLFIPDIDKWQNWQLNIVEEVKKVDFAFLDATFYSDSELPGRKMEEVPHPFVPETMTLFENQGLEIRKKVCFIHFNHTNPLLWDESKKKELKKRGFGISEPGKIY